MTTEQEQDMAEFLGLEHYEPARITIVSDRNEDGTTETWAVTLVNHDGIRHEFKIEDAPVKVMALLFATLAIGCENNGGTTTLDARHDGIIHHVESGKTTFRADEDADDETMECVEFLNSRQAFFDALSALTADMSEVEA